MVNFYGCDIQLTESQYKSLVLFARATSRMNDHFREWDPESVVYKINWSTGRLQEEDIVWLLKAGDIVPKPLRKVKNETT